MLHGAVAITTQRVPAEGLDLEDGIASAASNTKLGQNRRCGGANNKAGKRNAHAPDRHRASRFTKHLGAESSRDTVASHHLEAEDSDESFGHVLADVLPGEQFEFATLVSLATGGALGPQEHFGQRPQPTASYLKACARGKAGAEVLVLSKPMFELLSGRAGFPLPSAQLAAVLERVAWLQAVAAVGTLVGSTAVDGAGVMLVSGLVQALGGKARVEEHTQVRDKESTRKQGS